MFWTAVVWGLGVSFGGSIGLMAFVLMFAVWKAFSETETAKTIEQHNDLVLAALLRRNDLTAKANEDLEKIAIAMSNYWDQAD